MLDWLVYSPMWMDHWTWLMIVAFIFAFFVSYGMGANDSCNDWGTAVGAGTVKLWEAYVLCGIFNTLGAVLLGYKVTETLRSGIVDLSVYDVYAQYNASSNSYDRVAWCDVRNHTPGTVVFTPPEIQAGIPPVDCAKYTAAEFMHSQTGAMAGVAVFMVLSSVFKIPVSATHAIVGGTLASSLYLRGNAGIKWTEITGIVISWFISPLIAGVFASIFYIIVKWTVFLRKDTFNSALFFCPLFMCFTLTVNLYACVYDGSKYLGFDKLNWWQAGLLCIGVGVISAVVLGYPMRNWLRNRAIRLYEKAQRKAIEKGPEVKKHQFNISNKITDVEMAQVKKLPWYKVLMTAVHEDPKTAKVFDALQIVSSTLLSFSHGANDTGNTVGPLLAIWLTYKTGYSLTEAETRDDSQLLLAFGAVAMIFGFVTLGHRTIKLIAKEFTAEVTPASGFCVELATAFTVLVCVKIGIPISSTHCAVGAVLFVGMSKNTYEGVSWPIFRRICAVWLACFPVSGVIAFVTTWILMKISDPSIIAM